LLLRCNVRALQRFRGGLDRNACTGDCDTDASVHASGNRFFNNRFIGDRLWGNRFCGDRFRSGLLCYALRYGLCRLLNGWLARLLIGDRQFGGGLIFCRTTFGGCLLSRSLFRCSTFCCGALLCRTFGGRAISSGFVGCGTNLLLAAISRIGQRSGRSREVAT
jgi:hypothetical protein